MSILFLSSFASIFFDGRLYRQNRIFQQSRSRKTTTVSAVLCLIGVFLYGCKSTMPDKTVAPIQCVTPSPGMQISNNTTFCPGLYQVGEENKSAVTLVGDNIALNCAGAFLVGNRKGDGITINGEGNTIDNCNLSDFLNGISAINTGSRTKIRDVSISDVTAHFIQLVGNDEYELFDILIMNARLISSETGGGLVCGHCINSLITNVFYFNDGEVVESPFHLGECRNTTVKNNIIISLGGKACNGIWVAKSSRLQITNNYVLMRGSGEGSHIIQGSENIFSRNEFIVDPPSRILSFDADSNNNVVFENVFRRGLIVDNGVNNQWCQNGVGNFYLDGARYEGKDINRGSCQH